MVHWSAMSQHQWGGGYAPQGQGYPPVYVPVAPLWRCSHCGSTRGTGTTSSVSGAGWIVFVLLIFVCFIFCWLGLLMKQEHSFCLNCGRRALR